MSHIESFLQQQVLVLDGAMGTELAAANLGDADFGGSRYVGCSEILTVTRPDLIRDIHYRYIEAGAHFLTTNTFGANQIVLSEYGLEKRVDELNKEAVLRIREALAQSNAEGPHFIVGDLGPSSKAYSVTGGISLAEISDIYFEQAVSLLEADVDILMFETIQDVLNLKAAHSGVVRAFEHVGKQVPIWISVTIESTQTTLAGQTIDAFYTAIEHIQPLVVGMNCALGPEHLREGLSRLSKLSKTYVSFHPNAGLPDEDGQYNVSPEAFFNEIQPLLTDRCLNIVGGCCGTRPEHIQYVRNHVGAHQPHACHCHQSDFVSGLVNVALDEFIVVGERTNTIGSKIFRELIAEEKFAEAVEIARTQVNAGAKVLDVCLANPDRDEVADMLAFVRELRQSVKVPLMIDTTNIEVLEAVLPEVPGKMIVNSVNFERGDAYFEQYVRIAKKHGAKIVVGLIDEAGMAVSFSQKMAIFDRLKAKMKEVGLKRQDVIIDPLVFPIATGDTNYDGAANATLDAIAAIHNEDYYTVLGLSNVSFGLPLAGRLYINDLYLNEAKKRGLSMALINAAHHMGDDTKAITLGGNLLQNNTQENIDAFITYIRTLIPKKAEKKETIAHTPEESLAQKVRYGTKLALQENIQQLLDCGMRPLDVINGPLMSGMDEVGILFGKNELIVTEVLQSASVMKESVAYLEQFMETGDKQKRGKVIFATVKGDVHDIGKNLVGIIFENNGYDVLDLGINVDTARIIEAIGTFKPDMIGLSGLLVKSAHQMVEVVSELEARGIHIPIMIGGAALTRRFVATRIAPRTEAPVFYCPDAMIGLDYANQLQSDKREACIQTNIENQQKTRELAESTDTKIAQNKQITKQTDSTTVEKRTSVKKAPLDYERHEIHASFSDVYPFVNESVLFSRHLGIKGGVTNPKYQTMKERLVSLIQTYGEAFQLRGVFQVFPVKLVGETIQIQDTTVAFEFPRQQDKKQMALQDFLHPEDTLGMFVVTAGNEVFELAAKLESTGDYEGAHILKSLTLELAEAMAEYVHQKVREHYRVGDGEITIDDILKANYTGKRYSFGYPACPDLEDQAKLFALLKPENLGIELSPSMMMSPLASVSAIVFYNEKATYFTVS